MKNLINDYKRYKKYKRLIDIITLYLSSKSFQAVCLYRISNYMYIKKNEKNSCNFKKLFNKENRM